MLSLSAEIFFSHSFFLMKVSSGGEFDWVSWSLSCKIKKLWGSWSRFSRFSKFSSVFLKRKLSIPKYRLMTEVSCTSTFPLSYLPFSPSPPWSSSCFIWIPLSVASPQCGTLTRKGTSTGRFWRFTGTRGLYHHRIHWEPLLYWELTNICSF